MKSIIENIKLVGSMVIIGALLLYIGTMLFMPELTIKIFRFQILYSFISNQLKRIIYPKGIFILKYDKTPVDDKFVSSIISFMSGNENRLITKSITSFSP